MGILRAASALPSSKMSLSEGRFLDREDEEHGGRRGSSLLHEDLRLDCGDFCQ